MIHPATVVLAVRRAVLVALALVLAVGGWGATARAQCPPGWVTGIGVPGVNGNVNALTVMQDGDVIAGGNFTTAAGIAANRIVRVNVTTGVWTALGAGTNTAVNALALLHNGDLIAGGTFTTAGGVPAVGIACYHPTAGGGGVWSPVGSGTNDVVEALVVLHDGDVIAGGRFTTAGGVAASCIARYNPNSGVWTALGTGTNSWVHALAVLPTGDLIAGGRFSIAGGVAANGIARCNPNTGVWTALGAGTSHHVLALAASPGSDLIVGGLFTTAGGVAGRNYIARYNWITGVWSALGTGASSTVNSLAYLEGGDLIVGGAFGAGGGVSANRIARVNTTTNVWTAIGAGTNDSVLALAVKTSGDNSDIVLGGSFTSAGGVEGIQRIAVYGVIGPPIITSQSLPITMVPSGGNAVFYVGATAGFGSRTLTYQWRKGGVAINTIANPSAATPALSLTNVQAADVGSYDCLVTNSCGGTGTASNAATLTFVTDPCPVDFNGDGFLDFFDYDEFVTAYEIGC